MSLLGSYLTLELDGSVIAETTSVSMKMQAKALDATTYDSGLYPAFIGGKVDIALAGTFLLATSGANWNVLWTAFKDGALMGVNMICNGITLLTGQVVIAKLRLSGGNSDKIITGGYALQFKYGTVSGSMTADTTLITADTTLITADAI